MNSLFNGKHLLINTTGQERGYPIGACKVDGIDLGRGLVRMERERQPDGKVDSMSMFNSANDVAVIYVPGQGYWAARWRTGYAPAHYLILQVEPHVSNQARSETDQLTGTTG